MKTAVIYARFSSHSQQEQSIDGQLRACREYALKNNMTVVAEYCDRAKSGTNSKRPEFQRMLRDSETGSFEIVLVYQYDRFARNRRESANNEFLLEAHGVKLISINEPVDDKDSTSVIIKGMFESIAEYYSKDLSKKVKRGLKESIIKRQSIGGIRLLGYKTDANMKIQIDELEAKVVRDIYSMRLSGMHVEEIVAELNRLNFKNKELNFNRNSVNKILKNEKYTGRYINPYNPIEIITDMYPAIISRDTYDAAQETFERYRHNSSRGVKNAKSYNLSGKLFSAVDGSIFSGRSGYSANGKKYGYYQATIADVVVRYSQEELEDDIIDSIKEIVTTDKYCEYLSKRMIQDLKKRESDSRADAIRARKREIQKQMHKISEAFLDAEGPMRTQLNIKMKDLQDELDRLDNESKYYDQKILEPLQNISMIKRYLKEEVFKDLDQPDRRRDFFISMLNSAFIVDNHIDIYLNLDVEKQVTFAQYKNDILTMEDVRFSSLMADQKRADTNFFTAYFIRNTIVLSFFISTNTTNNRKTKTIKQQNAFQ